MSAEPPESQRASLQVPDEGSRVAEFPGLHPGYQAVLHTRYQRSLELISEGVCIADHKGAIFWCNSAFERSIDRSRGELEGFFILDILSKSSCECADYYYAGGFDAANSSFRFSIAFPEPRSFEVSWEDLTDDFAGRLYIFKDITQDHVVQDLRTRHLQVVQERRQLQSMAQTCPVTGLLTRPAFLRKLRAALSAPGARRIAVCYLDLDGFKQVNDQFGHEVGDVLLKRVADIIREEIRSFDFASRFGGDEFVIGMANIADQQAAHALADRILARFTCPEGFALDEQGHVCRLGASLGIALAREVGGTLDDLIRAADQAMYYAKHSLDGNTISIYGNLHERSELAAQVLQAAVKQAIQDDHLAVSFNPIFDQKAQAVMAYQLSVQVVDVAGQLIALPDLYQAAKLSSQVFAFDVVVLRSLIRAAVCLSEIDHRPLCIIDVSASLMGVPNFGSLLLNEFATLKADLRCFVLQFKEASLLTFTPSQLEQVELLGQAGLTLWIDGFSASASTLSCLAFFPYAGVKLASSLLDLCPFNPQIASIVHSLIDSLLLAGIDVVADGISFPLQLQSARDLGVHCFQGSFLMDPVPDSEFHHLSVLAALLANPGLSA